MSKNYVPGPGAAFTRRNININSPGGGVFRFVTRRRTGGAEIRLILKAAGEAFGRDA